MPARAYEAERAALVALSVALFGGYVWLLLRPGGPQGARATRVERWCGLGTAAILIALGPDPRGVFGLLSFNVVNTLDDFALLLTVWQGSALTRRLDNTFTRALMPGQRKSHCQGVWDAAVRAALAITAAGLATSAVGFMMNRRRLWVAVEAASLLPFCAIAGTRLAALTWLVEGQTARLQGSQLVLARVRRQLFLVRVFCVLGAVALGAFVHKVVVNSMHSSEQLQPPRVDQWSLPDTVDVWPPVFCQIFLLWSLLEGARGGAAVAPLSRAGGVPMLRETDLESVVVAATAGSPRFAGTQTPSPQACDEGAGAAPFATLPLPSHPHAAAISPRTLAAPPS